VRNGKDIRHGVTGLAGLREDDAARAVLDAVLAANARFAPPQIGVTNDLTGLRNELRHPWAIKSSRDCSEKLPQEFSPHPVRRGLRRLVRKRASRADPGSVGVDIPQQRAVRHRPGHDWSL
jgi:hypothetical protein